MKIENGKLIKVNENDIPKNGHFVVPKDIRYIGDSAFIDCETAAPELLEACKTTEDRLSAWMDTADMLAKSLYDPEEAQEQINRRDNYGFLVHNLRAAIAKATK